VELSTHAAQDRELEAVRSQIMQLVLKLERPLYINKRNRQDRSGIVIPVMSITPTYVITFV
jgi:hypothetical protein